MGIVACPPTSAPVHGVVTFDANVFKAAYPAFATVDAAMLTLYFAYAQIILDNKCTSIVTDAVVRETLLNVLVAHLAALFSGANGQAPSGVVGRASSATQGSVSLTAEYLSTINQAWFVQTQWGALFWQLTAPYRTMRYVPPPASCYSGGPSSGRRGY